MSVAGKSIVLGTFAVGFLMAGGAWWYHYAESRRAAKFWGADGAALLVGSAQVTLVELGAPSDEGVAGRAAKQEFDLTEKKGLVHLRHALTYDANFEWEARGRQSLAEGAGWTFAMRFTKDGRELVVLFTRDFTRLGRVLDADGVAEVDVLPCPRLGPVIVKYMGEVGVPVVDGER
jgi:hypothetical protein